MIEANEVNSTFYALRLLSHGLDTSQIEVTDGEGYPASEFTKQEQELALKIIHNIEDSESVSFDQLAPDKIGFYLAALANRIEELANRDLVNAGYAVETSALSPEAPTQVEPALTAHEEAVMMRRRGLYQEMVVKQRLDAGVDVEWATKYPAYRTREFVDLLMAALESPETLHKVAGVLGLSHTKLLQRVRKYRSRQGSKTEPEARHSAQRS